MPAENAMSLDSFVEFLYGGLEGYAYLAASDPNDKTDWKQEFFKYPEETPRLVNTIKAVQDSHNVFLAPVLYKNNSSAARENVKVSNVVWTEFDGNAPDWEDSHGEPSLIIQSSGPLNQHVYWKLTEPLYDIDYLEDINLRITYNMGADSSAWDATQVLRPPFTRNHKYDDSPLVHVTVINDTIYDFTVFDSLAPAPEQIKADWELTALPDIQDVVLKYAFPVDMVRLLKADKNDIKDRSASLMNLAYGCAELGLNNNEIMAVLLLADDRWEKFKFRKDRHKRLAHIITVARNKYPDTQTEDEAPVLAFGLKSFLATEIEINWVIEGMLMDQGNMLMVGPSGIGKTQLTLQFLIHLALGKSFLHYNIEKAKKVLFLSLEMGHGELKIFLEDMAKALQPEEIDRLEQNLIIVPYGEPMLLNTPLGQELAHALIQEFQPEGFIVDSVGSSIGGNISSDENVQPFTQFNDRIRKQYGLFTWYIHHMRKVREGAANQDDVYGNQYLLNRSTSSYGVLPAKGGLIKIRNFKQRLAAKEKDFTIVRGEHLTFHSNNEDVDELLIGTGATGGTLAKAIGSKLAQEPISNISEGGIEL